MDRWPLTPKKDTTLAEAVQASLPGGLRSGRVSGGHIRGVYAGCDVDGDLGYTIHSSVAADLINAREEVIEVQQEVIAKLLMDRILAESEKSAQDFIYGLATGTLERGQPDSVSVDDILLATEKLDAIVSAPIPESVNAREMFKFGHAIFHSQGLLSAYSREQP